jgi:lipopolysaccharide transport system permease protein
MLIMGLGASADVVDMMGSLPGRLIGPAVAVLIQIGIAVKMPMSASATNIPMSELTPSHPAVPASPAAGAISDYEQVIQPTRGWIAVNWREMFEGRELLYFLIWRDLKVRYKQAILGVAWVVIQPIMNMIMFTLIFGNAAGFKSRLPGHEHEYAIFVYSALLPWQLFSYSLNSGGMSLVSQQNIVKKIYFPRLFVPTASVGGAIVDMGISFFIVMFLVLFNHVPITPMLLLLPLLVLLGLLNSLGIAYLLSGLTVRYRDFRFIIPFMSQVLMFASFVAFPPNIIKSAKLKWLLLANPMYGVVAGFRKCIVSDLPNDVIGFDWRYIASSLIGGLILFFVGIFVFRRTERTFADIA